MTRHVPNILELLGIPPSGLDDSPRLQSLGAPQPQPQPEPPPDVPLPTIATEGIEGALALLDQQRAPQEPPAFQPIGGDPGFSVQALPPPPEFTAQERLDALRPPETSAREKRALGIKEDFFDEEGRFIDRSPPAFGGMGSASFSAGVP